MNRLNLVLISIALISLMSWYLLIVRQVGLIAPDKDLTTKEDMPLSLHIGSKGPIQGEYEIDIVKEPAHGSLSFYQKRYIYIPEKDFTGNDQFTYRLKTKKSTSNTAKISINITPQNDAPLAKELIITTIEDTPASLTLKGKDVEGDYLTYRIVSPPTYGKISGVLPNLEYKPNQDFFGSDYFTYRVADKYSESAIATAKISVVPINDKPVAVDGKITTTENSNIEFALKGFDVDNDNLSYELLSQPRNGQIIRQGDKYVYEPHKYFFGHDRIRFIAKDNSLNSSPATIDIEVRKIDHSIELKEVLTNFLKNGGVAIGNYKQPEYVVHGGKYIPASILKIVTAAASLHHLGKDFRFKTEFFIDEDDNLYIKGYGDPSLSSQDWHEIARILQENRIFEQDLNSMIIDITAFSGDLQVDGRRKSLHYYDSPPSSLATNYNVVSVRIESNRRIVVSDDYTPLTQMVVKKAKGLPRGFQHFSIALDSNESVQYSAELAEKIFSEYGAYFGDIIIGGRVPQNLKTVLTYESRRNLAFVVKEMLRDSNNFIANQLLLTLAYQQKGEGVSIKNGAEIVADFMEEEIGIKHSEFALVEGSGLSTKNNIDLMAMLKIVNYFNEYKYLLPHLSTSKYPDLARTGRKWNIIAKTGTLNNTANLAGFIQLQNDKWKPFVIMLNDETEMRGAVMEIIAKYYNG